MCNGRTIQWLSPLKEDWQSLNTQINLSGRSCLLSLLASYPKQWLQQNFDVGGKVAIHAIDHAYERNSVRCCCSNAAVFVECANTLSWCVFCGWCFGSMRTLISSKYSTFTVVDRAPPSRNWKTLVRLPSQPSHQAFGIVPSLSIIGTGGAKIPTKSEHFVDTFDIDCRRR
jgi:hypothetical protein